MRAAGVGLKRRRHPSPPAERSESTPTHSTPVTMPAWTQRIPHYSQSLRHRPPGSSKNKHVLQELFGGLYLPMSRKSAHEFACDPY
eukprot:1186801-Prorocentrum_minimum.AAC.2